MTTATLPVLEAQDLARHYELGRGPFRKPAVLKAVAGASFALFAGRTLCVPGLVNKLLAVAGELPPRAISVEVNRLLLRG